MDNVLECRAVCKNYRRSIALKNVNLTIPAGRIVGLLGPNGSGKTTLIKLINGLLTPTSGEILVNGKPVGAESKALVSYLPDQDFLADWMTTEGMIAYYEDFFADFSRERAERMLENLGIDRKKRIKTLSKGTREKVALILTMSRRAKLYLLDEPIAGVDPATRDYILHTILQNFDGDSSILISTHLISDVEAVLTDVLFLKNGEIVLADTAEHLREETGKTVDEHFREVFRC